MDDVAVGIAENLDFNMSCFFNPFFNVNVPIPKSRFTLCFRSVKKVKETRLIFGDSDAPTAPTCHGFDPDRVSDLLGELRGLLGGVNCSFFVIFAPTPLTPGYQFKSSFCDSFTCLHFITHGSDVCGGGSNKLYLMRLTNFRKLRVLSEETRARVDGIDIRIVRNSDNIRVFQITLS